MLRNPASTPSSREVQPEDTQKGHSDEWAELAAMTGFVPEPPLGQLKARPQVTDPLPEPQPEPIAEPTEAAENVALLDNDDLRESEETTTKTPAIPNSKRL